MSIRGFGRFELSCCLVGAVLAGCGGSQSLISGLPQSGAISPQNPSAPKYQVLFRFPSISGGCPDGAWPWSGLVTLGTTLYGKTYAGGAQGAGTVFSMSTAGKERVLYSFGAHPREGDGGGPEAALLVVNGSLYGTTPEGGKYGGGMAFSLNPHGKERVLHSFGKGSDGAKPQAGLIAINGTIYGTTSAGGAYGDGTVFSETTTGSNETVLHSFRKRLDGEAPEAALLHASGWLYGTTTAGGALGAGTLFRISTTGLNERVLHTFGEGADGKAPRAPLTAVKDTLYGTTVEGGRYGSGSQWAGTVFSIRTTGRAERVLHSFGSGSDGQAPMAPVIEVNGALYGTTARGGTYASGGFGGTLYGLKLSNGDESVLHSFGRGSDGSNPAAPLTEMNGTLYGTTLSGGINSECVASGSAGNGTIFAFGL